MDIWHRVGRIVRFSNLGTLLFFTLKAIPHRKDAE